jgi:DNA-binding NarL/FixJ family response regulator
MHEVCGEISFYAGLSDVRVNQERFKKTMRVLLADDQPRVRSAIRLLLEQQQVARVVEEVTNAQELLDHVRNRCPDMLLLDWELPGLVPDELPTTLHTLNPGLFIIVLDSIPHTRQAALEAGANEFVSKNEPPERLLTAIRSYKDLTRKKISKYKMGEEG